MDNKAKEGQEEEYTTVITTKPNIEYVEVLNKLKPNITNKLRKEPVQDFATKHLEKLLNQNLDIIEYTQEYNSLDDKEQQKVRAYNYLYDWLNLCQVRMQLNCEIISNSYSQLFFKVTNTINAEKTLQKLENFPKIVISGKKCKKEKEDNQYIVVSEKDENILRHLKEVKNPAEYLIKKTSILSQIGELYEAHFLHSHIITIESRLSVILAYREFIKLITDFTGIEKITEIYSISTYGLLQQIESLNGLVENLKLNMQGDQEIIREKRKFLNNYIPNIDTISFYPSKTLIQKAKTNLSELLYKGKLDKIIDILLNRYE